MTPYDFCNQSIRHALFGEKNRLFGLLWGLLIRQDGLLMVQGDSRGALGMKDWGVLQYVAKRTISFSKPFEWVYLPEVMSTPSGIRGSEMTVRKLFSDLVKGGLLVRASTDYGRVVFYGLNTPRILSEIDKYLEAVGDTKSKTYDLVCKIREHPSYPTLVAVTESLNGKGGTYEELQKEVLGLKLEQAMPAALGKSKAKAVEMMRKNSILDVPYEELEPKGRGAKCLAEWDRALTYSPIASEYLIKGESMKATQVSKFDPKTGTYKVTTKSNRATGKTVGLMKSFVSEMMEQGLSGDDITKTLNSLVNNWDSLAGKWVSTAYVNDKGEPGVYKDKIDILPNFAIFYRHRYEIMRALKSMEVTTAQVKVEERAVSESVGGVGW